MSDLQEKTKSSKKKKRTTPLLSKIMFPMMILALVQILAIWILLLFSGVFSYLKRNSYDLLYEKTGNRKNYIENVFNQKTSLVYETANEVNKTVEEILENEGLTIDAVKNDREFNKLLLSSCSDKLISLIRQDLVNDSFIILESGSLYDKTGRKLRTGLYFRDTDVNESSMSDNKDIFMEMGISKAAKDLGLTLDYDWSLYIDVTDEESGNYDFYYNPINSYAANANKPLYSLGFWSGLSGISNSHKGSIKYTLPLVIDGKVYGVIGIGLMEKTIQQNIPDADFSNDSACYVLALDEDGDGIYEQQLHQGYSYDRLIGGNKSFRTDKEIEHGLYEFSFEGFPDSIGSVMDLNLYKSGSPYRNQRWALISVADKEINLKMYYSIIRTIRVSMLTSLMISIIVAALISRRFSRPVKKMVWALNKSNRECSMVEFNSSGISEIDILADAIKKQQIYIKEYTSKLKDDEYTEKLVEANETLKAAYASAKQANLAKTDFLSRMSHDIRTPMNAVIGMTRIARNNIDNRKKLEDCFDKITVSSNYLLSLINEVLDMSKIEGGKFVLSKDKVNILKLLDNLIEMTKPALKDKGHELKVSINNIMHENILGDALRIQQVFMNILSNAIKYTPEGGHLSVSASEKDIGQKKIGCYEFIFTDDGKGMAPEFIEKVFSPFEREEDERVNKEQGTGLGMTIAYNIVKMMDGDIKVESKVNKGSKFTVTLLLTIDEDMKEDESSSVEEIQSFDESDFEGCKVLLVDDNELNREIAVELLEMAKLEVDIAWNGQEAVEKFETSEVGCYDFILMDVQMPIMNGYDATRTIRSLSRQDAGVIPIIAMTANAFAEDVMDAKNAGMNAHIAKPLDVGKVFETLSKVLKQEKIKYEK